MRETARIAQWEAMKANNSLRTNRVLNRQQSHISVGAGSHFTTFVETFSVEGELGADLVNSDSILVLTTHRVAVTAGRISTPRRCESCSVPARPF